MHENMAGGKDVGYGILRCWPDIITYDLIFCPRTQSLADADQLGSGLDSSQGPRARCLLVDQRFAVAKQTVQGEGRGGEIGLPMLE